MPAPRILTNIVLLAAAAIIALFIAAMLAPPYLGFSLTQSEDGRFVIEEADTSLASVGLKPGVTVLALSDETGHRVDLTLAHLPQIAFANTGYVEDGSETYVAHATAIADVHEILASGSVTIHTADDRAIHLELTETRTLANISWINWFYLLIGFLVLLPASIIWAWRPSRPETICLALASFGFFLTAVRHVVAPHNIDLYFPGPWLHWVLTESTDLGRFLSFGFGGLFVAYYPQALSNAKRWLQFVLTAVLIYLTYALLNDYDFSKDMPEQFLHFSFGESTAVLLFSLPLLIYFSIRQWQSSKQKPVERAQLKWIFLAFFLGPVVFLVAFQLPILLGQDPFIVRPWLSLVFVVSPFLMIALGVARFNLFNLEHYVGIAYTWTAVSIVFFVTDLMLISLVALTPTTATFVAVALVLWIYFPIRQWVAARLTNRVVTQTEERYNRALRKILSGSLSDNPEHPHRLWESVLQETFSPAKLDITNKGPDQTSVVHRGQGLYAEKTAFSEALLLEYADNGARLFDASDVQLLNTLSTVYEQILSHRDAYASGQYAERERIRRDLHDQIGSNLVSLVYTAKEDSSKKIATETLAQLRELVRALRTDPVSPDTLAADIRQLCQTSCSNLDLKLNWHADISTERHTGPTEYLNLMNITRELLSNTIKHAQATTIQLSLVLSDEEIQFSYADDGQGFITEETQFGNGMRNLEARAQELGGQSDWQVQDGFSYRLVLAQSGV